MFLSPTSPLSFIARIDCSAYNFINWCQINTSKSTRLVIKNESIGISEMKAYQVRFQSKRDSTLKSLGNLQIKALI